MQVLNEKDCKIRILIDSGEPFNKDISKISTKEGGFLTTKEL